MDANYYVCQARHKLDQWKRLEGCVSHKELQKYDYLIKDSISSLNDAMRKLRYDTIRDVQDVSSA